jgi:hypothetical protein
MGCGIGGCGNVSEAYVLQTQWGKTEPENKLFAFE